MAPQSPRHMASNVSRSSDYQNRQIISFLEIALRRKSSMRILPCAEINSLNPNPGSERR
jgi:hypothetical protein